MNGLSALITDPGLTLALTSSETAPMRLVFEPGGVWLAGAEDGRARWQIAPGVPSLLQDHFMPRASPAAAMETAIAAIEDVLANVPQAVHGAHVASAEPMLHAIARAAGLAGNAPALSVEAVEQVFVRASAVATGRPAASEGLPEDEAFVPALLVVRELMHHLQIASIRLSHAPETRG